MVDHPRGDVPRDERLRITEIYASVQGESTWAGLPCTFVRLTGCNLRCTWCDSEFTFTGGEHRSIDEVIAEVDRVGVPLVEVTGGEPLAQRQAVPLMQRLLDRGYTLLLETSGSIDIAPVPEAVHVIMDLKPPDSGEVAKNLLSNLDALRPHHEVKFVLASRRDFDWAVQMVRAHRLHERVRAVLLSVAWGQLDPKDLVDWTMATGLPLRVQLQMHKVIWPPDARGV
ncbi:MAG: radical SAM protein [Alphaproteobacteria bacterium]|nr:radical SAM protein [Alphaproteobacteria bacterium]MCB9792171.1 radical SAM protein [Alphaproteobacteria bacterium]